jgi:two-component system sensor histidine kinase PilS (NtrC family)
MADATTRELVQVEHDSLVRSLFTVAAIRLVVVSLVLVGLVSDLVLRPRTPDEVVGWHFGLIAATYGMSLVYLGLLRFTHLVRGLAYIQIGLDGLLVTALVFMTQGVESPFAFAYVFVVLASSMTLYRPGALLAAATTIVLFGGVLGLQLVGSVGGLPSLGGRWESAVLSYLGHSAGMVVVAFLASALAEKLRATGEKLAQKEHDLEQLGNLHAAILRSLPAGVLTVDAVGVIRFANDAALNILRTSPSRLLGRHLEQAVDSMAPAWRTMRERQFREAHRERFEADFERADGETIRLGFSVAPLSLDLDLSAIIVFQDVTDIVRLKDAVARSERLASVGQFAAGLAHEVRNPLASMCASIDVLSSSLDPPPAVRGLMHNITREAERLNGLITDFLSLARPRRLHVLDVDLAPLVTSILDVFEHELPNEVRVRRRIMSVTVRVDQDLMTQVVWNLVRNARDALESDGGGTIDVDVGEDEQGAYLQVSDDGPGVTPELQSKIFDPFYTTKQGGSGLGLAISNSIVEAHGAEMWFDSQPGEGTEVTVRFTAVTSNLPLSEAV